MDVDIHWRALESYKTRGGPYVARVSLVGTFASEDWRAREKLTPHVRAAAEAACTEVSGLLPQPDKALSVEISTHLFESNGMLGVSWTVEITYARPKDMPASAQGSLDALGISGCDDVSAFAPIVRSAIEAGIKARDDAERDERELRWANTVVRHYAERVRQMARSVCRYEQRMAALQAEYRAERAAQAAKLITEHDGEIQFADATEPLPSHVVRAALAALPGAVEHEPGPFHLDHEQTVTAEALAEAKSQAKPKG